MYAVSLKFIIFAFYYTYNLIQLKVKHVVMKTDVSEIYSEVVIYFV